MKTILCAAVTLFSSVLIASPAEYAADVSTPEARATLVKRLWAHDEKAETKLWPEGKTPLKVSDKPIKFLEHELWQSNLVVTDINEPFFTFFPAKGEGPRPVVVVLPGGGYLQLGWNKEGTEVAEWLNGLGFSAAVLLYRAPNQRDAALCDVQRTIGILRSKAADYNVRPDRIGVIGFSAGANLAVRSATNWRTRLYDRIDAADDVSCRPDFQLPIYPWDLLLCLKKAPNGWPEVWETSGEMKLDPAYPVDAQTPPAFIVQAQDDFCQIETSIGYYLALRKAGVRSALHVYPDGGHGYGQRRMDKAIDHWNDVAAEWLKTFVK